MDAKKDLGSDKGFVNSPLINNVLDANLDKGLQVINEKNILPVKGLYRVFSKAGSREYYIRRKDRFFRINREHSKNTISIYSKSIKKENLISEVISSENGVIYPATDEGRHDMKTRDTMFSRHISRAAAEFYNYQEGRSLYDTIVGEEYNAIRDYGRMYSGDVNAFLYDDMPDPYVSVSIRESLVETISFIRSGLKKYPLMKVWFIMEVL
ncbi:hypothetical protein [Serratia liquefaciens]|uniref:hypothetical protein n=1 Tax=Serratia liquefaciens TaxID=614 RepID=UPI0021583F22|nr:hypothetical protein [Serratia liquefaciens]